MVSLTPYIINPSYSMPSMSESLTFKTFLKRFHTQQTLWIHIMTELKDHQKRHSDILETYHHLNRSRERQKNLATSLLECRHQLKEFLLFN